MELVQFRIKDDVFFIRLIGRLEFRASAALDTVIHWIKDNVLIKQVVVDLNLVTSIDSTNLGLLAQLGLYLKQRHRCVPILQTLSIGHTSQVQHILNELQLNTLYCWQEAQESFDLHHINFIGVLGPVKESEIVICERAIMAHWALIGLSESNRAEFTSVIVGLQIEKSLLKHQNTRYQALEKIPVDFGNLQNLEVNQCYVRQQNQRIGLMH